MRPAEKGFLLLTSHLGDPDSKPLTVAQLRRLAMLVRGKERPKEDRELSRADLISLGYDRQSVDRILWLLSREDQLEYYINQAAKADCYPITRISQLYPEALRNRLGLDSPGCLWAKGDSSLLNCPGIAVIGSRDLAPENLKFAAEAGKQAAQQEYVLISGNARGADRTAQESCLFSGGQVISVVADSLKKCKSQPGVLYLSEDGFDEGFSAHRALSRNRLIHAMGIVTIVAQCNDQKGGTWSGTTQNLQNGWSQVFCYADGSRGTAQLIQMGATAVDIWDLANISQLQNQNISMFDL